MTEKAQSTNSTSTLTFQSCPPQHLASYDLRNKHVHPNSQIKACFLPCSLTLIVFLASMIHLPARICAQNWKQQDGRVWHLSLDSGVRYRGHNFTFFIHIPLFTWGLFWFFDDYARLVVIPIYKIGLFGLFRNGWFGFGCILFPSFVELIVSRLSEQILSAVYYLHTTYLRVGLSFCFMWEGVYIYLGWNNLSYFV